jgi:hypothetical protein
LRRTRAYWPRRPSRSRSSSRAARGFGSPARSMPRRCLARAL